MKLCVIGNSQMAVLKLAWDRIGAEFPAVTMQFFGASGAHLEALDVAQDRLVPRNPDLAAKLRFTSGGDEAIAPARHDAVLLAGLNHNLGPGLAPGYSQAVQRAAALDGFRATLCGQVFAQVRQAAPQVPVLVMPNPLRRRAPRTDSPALQPYADRLATLRAALQGVWSGVDVIGQPPATIVAETWTDAAYGVDAVGLDQGRGVRSKGEDDITHMNVAYGEAVLRHWLPGLALAA